jgi:hypothetical protein
MNRMRVFVRERGAAIIVRDVLFVAAAGVVAYVNYLAGWGG